MLDRVCTACGSKRKKQGLVYDGHLRPYCVNVCSSAHPNSPANLKKRNSYADMITFDDAQALAYERADTTYAKGARTANRRMRSVESGVVLRDTISFRIRTEEQAQYLMYVMGREGYIRISEAIQKILEDACSSDNEFQEKKSNQTRIVREDSPYIHKVEPPITLPEIKKIVSEPEIVEDHEISEEDEEDVFEI